MDRYTQMLSLYRSCSDYHDQGEVHILNSTSNGLELVKHILYNSMFVRNVGLAFFFTVVLEKGSKMHSYCAYSHDGMHVVSDISANIRTSQPSLRLLMDFAANSSGGLCSLVPSLLLPDHFAGVYINSLALSPMKTTCKTHGGDCAIYTASFPAFEEAIQHEVESIFNNIIGIDAPQSQLMNVHINSESLLSFTEESVAYDILDISTTTITIESNINSGLASSEYYEFVRCALQSCSNNLSDRS